MPINNAKYKKYDNQYKFAFKIDHIEVLYISKVFITHKTSVLTLLQATN